MREKRFKKSLLEKSYKKSDSFKLSRQFTAVLISFFLTFNPVAIPIIYAEEATPSANEIEVQVTPVPENILTTGGADSNSATETTANITEAEVPGTITSPTEECSAPEAGTTCPSGTIIYDKTAEISDSGSSDANTGGNSSIITEGNIDISSGNATASGSIRNNINQTSILIAPPNATPSAEATNSAALSFGASESSERSSSEEQALTIVNNNDGNIINNLSVNADTGLNVALGDSGNIGISTGDALAYGNIVNALNLNFVGSEFQLLVLNISNTTGNIDLNRVWKGILEGGSDNQIELALGSDTNLLSMVIYNSNSAKLDTNASINSNSGLNQATEGNGNVGISTGNSTAVGNVVNLVNGNIVGSKILFVVINIFNDFNGNLIVPRPQSFQGENESSASGIFINNNTALIDDSVNTTSLSGGNDLVNGQGNLDLTTGEAKSVSNSTVITNLTLQKNNLYSLLINNLGIWTGSIYGWENPSAEENTDFITKLFTSFPESTGSADIVSDEDQAYPIDIYNKNQAESSTDLDVTATSGLNKINIGSGSAKLKTGKATALGNLFDLINFNILGSRMFMGVVNNLGNWNGDYVSAFPDTAVSVTGPEGEVTPGSDMVYTINYKNQGEDPAPGTFVKFSLPKGASYISDNSGFSMIESGNELTWNLGEIKEGLSGSFEIKLHLDSNLKPDDLLSFLNKVMDKIVTPAYADEGGKRGKMVVNVSISTSDDQSKTDNDSSSATTAIFFPDQKSTSSESDNQNKNEKTTILITAKNNVGKFIYPGDTITYELTAKNIGGVTAKNVTVSQRMYDGGPQDMGTIDFPVGDIEPGKVIDISFGLALNDDIVPDVYYTETYATGENTTSSVANTQFEVKANSISFVQEVKAAEKNEQKNEPSVLGQQTCPVIEPKKEWFPWILATTFAFLWFIEFSRRKEWIEKSKMIIKRK